jgi:uncharacterized glyoxalase superfamily protein PhnB
MPVTPMIAYEDGVAALEWLSKAFGFRELMRMIGEGGRLAHGEMETGDGVIMMATPSPNYEGPKHHREHCEAARKWSEVPWVVDGALVYVDDVQKHYERAKEHGANILSEPETGSHGTLYRVEDIEGHRWMFMQRPVM